MRNTFLSAYWGIERAQEKTPQRKFTEWLMSIALERRLSKDQILELYLNDVWLGQRGSFAVHGVPEAARLFFGKDVSNVSLTEAATIAGVIQAPPALLALQQPGQIEGAPQRRAPCHGRERVHHARTPPSARRTSRCRSSGGRSTPKRRYFVDYVTQELQERTKAVGAIDVYTTLDLQLQRLAQDAVETGLARVDEILARRKRQKAQAALIAIDPRTGEILAMVGGRSYNQSQYNRAVSARRQPGSVFKPFVYLAAFERAQAEGRTDITPATVVLDEPTAFTFNDQTWTPSNYENEYDGPITLRRALALSRNIATIKVAESTGYDNVAALWKRIGAGTPPRPYPSIALGVFEATPYEIASAYTLFPNGGTLRPLRAIGRIVSDGENVPIDVPAPRTVARPDTTFLVTNMMRSVLNEGTGASARAARLRARRRRQVRHDQRSARRLVRRLHAGAADGRLGRPRRQPGARPQRQPGRAADLDAVHDPRAGRPRQHGLHHARRHRVRRHRPRHRQARDPGLPARLPRGVPRRHRADRDCALHYF